MKSQSGFIDELEETLIAFLLGAMTLITFANVIARYVFHSNILWALETTVFLFAWLVLMGMSYCFKHSLHLGVDVITSAVSTPKKRLLALLAVSFSLLYAVLLLKGSWDYWYPFATRNAWYEVNDIPMADSFQFLSQWFNDGEKYEKIPKFIPYLALPLGSALLVLRLFQAAIRIFKGTQDSLIASHEAEDSIDDLLDNKVDEIAHPNGGA